MFPIAWFFGFLYYTDVPSLALVVCTVVCALKGKHVLAALVSILLRLLLYPDDEMSRVLDSQTGIASCTFRQTNIIWVIYAWAYSRVTLLRYQRVKSGQAKLYDPPALEARPCAFVHISLDIFL